MSGPPPAFPDYGDNGDMAGARRMRRAFRLVVVSLVLFTLFLWVSEGFWQFEESERQYIRALTLPHDSARVFLLGAIRTDERVRPEHPTPKYRKALAVRSEDDVILREYAAAAALDPTDSLFIIRYGCELFRLNRPEEAAEQFRRASESPQENALPFYLTAAALARAGGDKESLAEAMLLVARTNGQRQNIVFPRPMWYSGYGQDGYWYAQHSHNIVDQACGPLYFFTEQIAAAVEQQIDQKRPQRDAKTWLEQIRLMGDRLAFHSEPRGAFQAIAGLEIELRAIDLMDRLATLQRLTLDESLIERRAKIKPALKMLKDFLNEREGRVEAERAEVAVPRSMGIFAALALFGTYLTAIVAYRILRYRKSSWALPHNRLGLSMLGGGAAVMFLLLQMITIAQGIPGAQEDFTGFVEVAWRGTIVVLVLFGLSYPAFMLKPVSEVARKASRPEEMDQTIRYARQAYRRAYASIALRYYGILWGMFVSVFCCWVISYRIFADLYPWEEKLIATGLLDAEREIVARALALLG